MDDVIEMLKNKLCDACLYKVESMSVRVEDLYELICDRCRERLIKALMELAETLEDSLEDLKEREAELEAELEAETEDLEM